MGTYPCSNCGATADTDSGCPACGHTVQQEIAELNRVISQMQFRNKGIADQQALLLKRIQGAITTRTLLLSSAEAGKPVGVGPIRPLPLRPTAVPAPPRQRAAPMPPPTRGPAVRPGRPIPSAGGGHGPEASTGSMQNVLLWLGALLFAVTGTGYLLRELAGGPRVLVFTLLAAAILGAPLPLTRRGLVTTAETLATVGLLFVLLDGYAVWSTALLAGTGITASAFAGVIFLAAAGVAAGYRWISHLVAPRFAALVLLQPVLPLLLAAGIHGVAGWSAVLAGVGAMNLGLTEVLRRRWHPTGVPASTTRHAAEGTPYLRDAVWGLHGLAVLGALVTATVSAVTASTTTEALGAAAALVLAATVCLGGGLTLRRWSLPDVAAGIATGAVILAVGRLAAVAAPGSGLVVTALAVLAAGIGGRWIAGSVTGPTASSTAGPATGVRLVGPGPAYAAALAAALVGLVLLGRGFDAVTAPLRAASPPWHADLGRYGGILADAAGPHGWALVLAALILTVAALIMLPAGTRADGAVIGVALTALLAPACLALPWAAAPVLLLLASLFCGGCALLASTVLSAGIRCGAAFLTGALAFGVSAARPDAGALTLIVITIAGAAIGTAPRIVEEGLGRQAPLAAEAGWAGAAFALPGAVALATAGTGDGSTSRTGVLAAGFVAVAAALAAAAMAQVARGAPRPLPVAGAAAGALVVSIASFVTSGLALADQGIAALLLASAIVLCLAPALSERIDTGGLDGTDIAAMAVTTAALAALARVSAAITPGDGLAIGACLVLLVALGLRAAPARWRRGPILGGSLVGVVVALIAGIAAVRGALATLGAVAPAWHTDLGNWSVTLPGGYGGQVPLALLMLAVAAIVVLPSPASSIACAVGVGLATVSLTPALGLPWWAPVLVGGLVSAVAGLFSGWTTVPATGWAWSAVSVALFGYTLGTSLVRPASTAGTLLAATAVFAAVACVADRSRSGIAGWADDPGQFVPGHLAQIGGFAVAGALCCASAGAGAAAAAAGAAPALALTSALAGLCVGLASAALLCRRTPGYLPYATGAVSVAGTIIAIATLSAHLPLAVYAAAATLLAVLAELLRAAVGTRPSDRVPATVSLPRRNGFSLLLSAGPATVLALAALAPSIVGALIGPYQTLHSIWSGAPASSRAALGLPGHWVGDARAVAAALLLTVAGGLAAVGLGGTRVAIASRTVAVVIPGAAVTLLIAPAALRLPWPAGPAAAVLVAALAGLGLAVTPLPPATVAAGSLRQARQLVLMICLLAAGAGLAGSLATSTMTLCALGGTLAAGVLAALYGRRRGARICGWLVTAFAGHLLALVAGLAAGLPAYWSAFGVAAVAGAMLVIAALLPRLRAPEAASESSTVEAGAYAGAVLALALAARSLPHLAVFTCAWGAVLSVAAARPGRSRLYRTGLILAAAAHEVVAWWLLMHVARVALPEAYTLAVAAAVAVIGYLEARAHPEVSSWMSYGIALVAAFLPSLAIALATGETPLRRGLLIVASALTVVLGAVRRQQAPVVVGGVALTVAALHELATVSTAALLWTVMAIVGGGLVALGANFEKRRRDLARLRGALGRLR